MQRELSAKPLFPRLPCAKGAVCRRQTEGLFCGRMPAWTADAVETQIFGLLLWGAGLRLSPFDR